MKHTVLTRALLTTAMLMAGGLLLTAAPAYSESAEEARLRDIADNDLSYSAVWQLLTQGTNPNVRDFHSRTAVHAAAGGCARQNLDSILKHGGDATVRDADGNTPLHHAARRMQCAPTIRVLVQHDAPVNKANQNGNTALHVAAEMNEEDNVAVLLDAGANPRAVNRDGLTPLQHFVEAGADVGRVVDLLLDAGADPNQKTPEGYTPLHRALKTGGRDGKFEVVKALLAGNADPCIRDPEKYIPYQYSVVHDNLNLALHDALDRAGGGELTCDSRTEEAKRPKEAKRAEKAKQAEEAKRTEEAKRPEEARRAEEDRRAEPWRAGRIFQDCDACPEMVVVPAGSFMMGDNEPGYEYDSERPLHQVTIAQPFAVGKYEVTFAEWEACVAGGGCNGYRPDDEGWGRGRRPVIHVSWEDAQNYVRWLSEETGKPYRLLSEAEWEYVARAGTTTRYTWGDEIGRNRANCYRCGSQWDAEQTAPVGMFAANAFGLHDVHGNVWEWTEDCWNKGYAGAPSNGGAWESGECSSRVLRGGSWDDVPRDLRSADRSRGTAGNRSGNNGFRLARTLTP